MESDSSKSKDRNGGESREGYKQSSDQQGDSKCCLYIKLSPRVNNEMFKTECERFGETEYAYVIYEPGGSHTDKKSRGYAFVRFKHEDEAISCKESLQGKEFYGQKCEVQFSKNPRPREKTPGQYLGHKKNSPGRSRSRSRSERGYRRSRDGYTRDNRDRYDKERDRRDKERSRHYRDSSEERDRRERRDRDRDRDRERDRGDRDRERDRDGDRYGRDRRHRERSEDSTDRKRRQRSRSPIRR